MNMTVNDFTQNGTTQAFSTFLNLFDMSPSIMSKAKAIIGIQKEKFDKAEQNIFDRFLSHFIAQNHKEIDSVTLIKMMELNFFYESLDYSKVPLPVEKMEKLPTDYVHFH